MIDQWQFNNELCNIHTTSASLISSQTLIEYRIEAMVKFTIDMGARQQNCDLDLTLNSHQPSQTFWLANQWLLLSHS